MNRAERIVTLHKNMITENKKYVNNNFLKTKFILIDRVQTDIRLSLGSRLLFSRLVIKYSNSNGQCWPGVRMLSEELGISVSTTKRYLKELTTVGYLIVFKKRKRKNAIYQLQDLEVSSLIPKKLTKNIKFNIEKIPREQRKAMIRSLYAN